jgi:hypothetical protein
MAHTVQIHITNEEPILAEIDELPEPTHNLVVALNPRTRDGKDLRNLVPNVTMLILPISRVHFIQVLPSAEEEKVVGFVRD